MPQYTLDPHQVEGVKFLEDMNGVGALLFEPGVGKTGTTLSWVDLLATRRKEVRVLVVAPLTAADTWVLQAPPFMDSVVKARVLSGSTVKILNMIKESHDWRKVPATPIMANHRGTPARQKAGNRVTILSMSAGALSSFCKDRKRKVQVLQAVRKYEPHVIVVDESHLIKSHNSNVSEMMYAMGPLAPHRIILTGTVNPHNPLDCYGQWRFMAPWTFSDQYGQPYTATPDKMTRTQHMAVKPWPWTHFEKRYAEYGGYGGNQIMGVNDYAKQELHDRVAERSMVVLKKDALNLPPVRDIEVHAPLDAHETRVYEEMRRDLAAALDSGELINSPNALAKMMKLRQVTAGFIKDTNEDSPTFGETFVVGHSKQKAVKEVVDVRLDGQQRIVVFAYFRSECAAIADMLKKKGRTVEIITGETKQMDRLKIRQRFGDVSGNPEQIVLVAQARTMSLAVNELITAQNAVFASLSERRDDWVQARGRLDRKGQVGQSVTFWNVLTTLPGNAPTVDGLQFANHERRGDMEKALFEHIKQVRHTIRVNKR